MIFNSKMLFKVMTGVNFKDFSFLFNTVGIWWILISVHTSKSEIICRGYEGSFQYIFRNEIKTLTYSMDVTCQTNKINSSETNVYSKTDISFLYVLAK